MKRTMIIILAMLLLLSSCGGTTVVEEETVADSSPQTETVTEETETELKDALPERDFEGAEYLVLAAAEQWAEKYVAEEETGEVLNDAVFQLNLTVEERFDVDILYDIVYGQGDGRENVRKLLYDSVYAGDARYDLFSGCSAYISDRILEGVFLDQNQLEYLDFSAPWWYHHINENITYQDILYVSAGFFGIQTIGQAWSILFNKELAEDNNISSLYDDVKEGEWTIEKMLSYVQIVTNDTDGNGVLDAEDTFGFIGTEYEPFSSMSYGLGRKIADIGEDGVPYLVTPTEHVVDVMAVLRNMINDPVLYFSCDMDPVNQMIPMFNEGKSLFISYPIRIAENEGMREGEDFGFLPLPKFDTEQEGYYTSCFAEITGIPTVVKDLEMSQIILEALNSTAYMTTVPAYYNTVLQRKLARDDESAEMLDLITKGITMDFGLLFYSTFGSALYSVGSHILRSSEYTTWWAKNETMLNSRLESVLESMIKIQENQG